jgi:hypothetical protein
MRLTFTVVFVFLALQSVAQTTSTTSNFSITLERVRCLGNCPDYTVTILGDGSVHYEGKAYVRVEGIRKRTIPASDVNKLIRVLVDEDFLHWDEKTELCVDYPEVRITASLDGQRKQVLEGCSAPGKVLTLAGKIDAISGTTGWVGNVRESMAKKTVAGRCGAPRDSFGNQPMPEQFYISDSPETARQVSCFTSFKKDATMFDVVSKCGIPDRHTGSGIYIFVYYMSDCSTVTVGTPDLKHVGIRHAKNGKTTILVGNW